MPDLDQLFAKAGPQAFAGPQCWDAKVVATGTAGTFVVIASYDKQLRWGPCEPANASVTVGQEVAVTQDENGTLWLVGAGGSGGGGTGPQGPPGPEGPAGAPGAKGATGPQGPTGPAGTQGQTGATGPAGSTGPQGPQGPSGTPTPTFAARAYRTGALALPQGFTTIAFDHKSFDTGNSFGSAAPYVFTAPVAGPYLVQAQVAMGTFDATLFGLTVQKNGVGTLTGNFIPAGQTNTQGRIVLADTIQLAAGDQLTLQAYNGSATASAMYTTGTVGADNFLAVSYAGGSAGPQGAQGATGATGATGPPGTTGPQGVAGPQGSQGATGTTGTAGSVGPQGPTGPSGPQGATGTTGTKGDTGAQGATGPQGATGAASTVPGPQGATGGTGPQGPAGAQGSQGVAGSTVRNGTGAPATATGVSGDFYIDTAVEQIYGPKTTVWGSATNLKGSQGVQGATGTTGSQGATGSTGPQGPAGPQGATGAQGPAAAVVPVVSTLPGSPVDGQEVYYLASETQGVLWRLRYRAGASYASKWEFVGGPPLRARIDTDETFVAGGSYVDAVTVGPQLTLPLAGDYTYEFTCNLYVASQTTNAGIGAMLSAPDGTALAQTYATNSLAATTGRNGTMLGVTAATVVKLQYNVSAGAGGTPHVRRRELWIAPIQVG